MNVHCTFKKTFFQQLRSLTVTARRDFSISRSHTTRYLSASSLNCSSSQRFGSQILLFEMSHPSSSPSPKGASPTDLPPTQPSESSKSNSKCSNLAAATPEVHNTPPDVTLEEACRIFDEDGCDPSLFAPLYDMSAADPPQDGSSAAVTDAAVTTSPHMPTEQSLSTIWTPLAEGSGRRVEKRPHTDLSDDANAESKRRRFIQRENPPKESVGTSLLVATDARSPHAWSRVQNRPKMASTAMTSPTTNNHTYQPHGAGGAAVLGRTSSWPGVASPTGYQNLSPANPNLLTALDELPPTSDHSRLTGIPHQQSMSRSWGNMWKNINGEQRVPVLPQAVYSSRGVNVVQRPKPTHKKVHAVSGRLLTANTPLERRHLYQALYPSLKQLMRTMQDIEARSRASIGHSHRIRLDCRYSEAYSNIAKDYSRMQQSIESGRGLEPLYESAHPEEWIDYIEDWDMPYRGLATAHQRQQWLQQHWNSATREAEKNAICPVIFSKECRQRLEPSPLMNSGTLLGLGQEVWIDYDPRVGDVVIVGMK
jgi:hypothetical protein